MSDASDTADRPLPPGRPKGCRTGEGRSLSKQVLRSTGATVDAISARVDEPARFVIAAAVEHFAALPVTEQVRLIFAARLAAASNQGQAT